ncbi:MAG: cyclic nucleotide-binding:Sulfate transporter/antisigma-factor antagonist [Rhodocyclaceae bacterium]|nr:MAG: cyclic nucleotide-binding:Sulfate transporter/antisigma-factor antagonist [Rhodocyclaceae bacterium]TND02563.1 MAG: cyclic nucleotide-binding:Sulfate transporter/antisigma-factor antagonist STAS:xanthine/uracil/vitamin C permease:sulfate transporter [Rhodocyclaceae bacterium]
MNFWAKRSLARGDFWGGLAAMLVAFPAAIAFGVTVYSAIGPSYAAYGALAGIVGVTVIGLVAASLGGTDRLISAPCAPAAAVLAAFAIEMVRHGDAPGLIVLLLVMVGMLAGLIQLGLGLLGVGGLIKYIPYPVVSGYLTGVGLIIIGSQIPQFVGAENGTRWWEAVFSASTWDWRAVVIGVATVAVTIGAPSFTQRVPGIILGILAGVLVYFGLALLDPALRELSGNHLVIGSLTVAGDGFLASLMTRWTGIGQMGLDHVTGIFGTALTLAVLLSIDTLKTCVVLDKLTRSRHDSNRELIAQGVANVAANAMGGMSGAGQMGATLVGLNSGSCSRTAGVLEGLFSLVAALLLSSYISWIPVATLAGILVVIGVRMIDREPLRFIQSRATMFDFGVVLAVVVVALTVGLIAASAVGVGMAIILFVREQIGGIVVRHKMELKQTSSSWHRPEAEVAILDQRGDQAVIFELQGSLFFGNTYQLYTDLEHEITTRSYVVIDLKRVQSIDVTAAQLFNQIRDAIRERGANLVLSGIRENHPTGRNLHEFLGQTGLWHSQSKTVRIFPDLDSAIAWVEDRLLGEAEYSLDAETPMQLHEMELFARHRDETLKELESRMTIRRFHQGEVLYSRGMPGDELYWVRRGAVRLVSTLGEGKKKPVASFGRGDFFGGLAFLDNLSRPNDAVAVTDGEVYVLTREEFNRIAEEHKKLAFNLAMAMARILAYRLRRTETKLTMLQEF